MEKSLCTLPDGGCLIETFGWTPESGVSRLDLHLARLDRSAEALGVKVDRRDVEARISSVQSDKPLRCRLTVAGSGGVELETAPMPQSSSLWKIAISDERSNSQDPFLRHKTSQRRLYDRTRAAMPEGIDEVIFLNEHGEVCEGTITNILVLSEGGEWQTPPISSGCLPGTYRQSLLESGKLTEVVLTLNDLRNAKEIRLCNALRGKIKASLIE